MVKFGSIRFLLLLRILVLATAAGTKGSSGNQWPQSPPQQSWPQTKGPLGGWDDDVSNPRGGYPQNNPQWKLKDTIPGIPGQSYPNFDKLPTTSFDCGKQLYPGYYADVEAQCQVFHICQADGRQNSFLCPVGTIFNQETFVCDWWFNVNCAETQDYASRNGNLFKSSYIGIDGMKVNSYFIQGGRRSRVNMQQPAVGIPGTGSQTKGGNWPFQGQSQIQGQFPQRGSIKGGNKNAAGNVGNQIWQNRGHSAMKGGQGRQNSGVDQKGSRRGQNPNIGNWQQRGSSNNMKGERSGLNSRKDGSANGQSQNKGGWQQQEMNRSTMKGGRGGLKPQTNQRGMKGGQNLNGGGWQQPGLRRRNNQKGDSFPRRPLMNRNSDWNMRGDMNNRNVNNMKQHVNNKGGRGMVMNQRQPNIQSDFNRNGDNKKNHNSIGMDQNVGIQQNKNFDANSWSLRPQNFQEGFQDRTDSGSDIWPINPNVNMELHNENYAKLPHMQLQNTNQPFRDDVNSLNPFDNADWNDDEEIFPPWNRNTDGRNEYGGNDFVSGVGHRWQNNENSNGEISWKIDKQWRKDSEEVDYDYA